jgi:hypothetical protein
MRFDTIAIVDWSAASKPRLGKDSIWLALSDAQAENLPTRARAEDRLAGLMDAHLVRGRRLLIGADFAFGYPAGFGPTLTGRPAALSVWEWLCERLEDRADNANNRFHVAAAMNRHFPGLGPFWFRPAALDLPDLPLKGGARHGHGMAELRHADAAARGAQSVFKLGGAGAVGSQVLTGLPVLWRLRARFAPHVAVWPFEDIATAPVVLAEVFPSLLAAQVAREQGAEVRDAVQVRVLARALWRLQAAGELAPLFNAPQPAREEGWILGLGHERALAQAAS